MSDLRNYKKKKSTGFKIFIGIICIFVLILGFLGGYMLNLINKVDTVEVDKENLGIDTETIVEEHKDAEKIVNIALFGVDATDGGVGRSDATMVATLDPIHNKLKLTSFMRDSYVYIDGHGQDKLNHAYAFGGPELAIRTLNQNFGLNIENFITVNFSSLPIIIDKLGGVDIEITADELNYINGYINDINNKDGRNSSSITTTGVQHLDGVQALAYSRIRYTDGGDYKRTERQRTVLEAIFKKLTSTPVTSYNSLLNDLLPYVQTNLSATDILSLGTKVISIGNNLEQDRFPRDGYAQGTMIDGIYYISFDIETTKNQVKNYIFEDIKE